MTQRVSNLLEAHSFSQCPPPACDTSPGSLLLIIDPKVPASTAAAVMHTAHQAELNNFQLVGRSEALRAVPLPMEFLGVALPSDDESRESCAAATLSRREALELRFDQILRGYEAALIERLSDPSGVYDGPQGRYARDAGFGRLSFDDNPARRIAELVDDEPDEWSERPAWDDALVVETEGSCRSGEPGEVSEMHRQLQGLFSAFDAAPKCSIAFFDVPAADATMSYREMVETIAALRAVDDITHVFLDTSGGFYPDTRVSEPPADGVGQPAGRDEGCSRTHVVGD